MKIIITGGAGFIGSNLALELVKRGHEVKIIDNFITGRIKNVTTILEELGIEQDLTIVKGDIKNRDFLEKEFKGFDAISHQAAIPSVPRSITDLYPSHDSNINGTFNVLVASKNVGVKKVVYASSSSIYGERVGKSKIETMKPQPLAPYAIQKLSGEIYCKNFAHLYGLSSVCLRYFNVFGPRQNPNSEYAAVVPKFIKMILNDKSPTIYGDGNQTRDFTYVKNVVNANILALNSLKVHFGETLNIACGRSISINELTELINKFTGKNIKPVYEKPRPGEIKHSLANVDKAKKLIGYKPLYSFEQGLKETIKWIKEKE
ncbi:LPS biosynthesis protein WbpP [Candidatus Pacearchaeota archaeon CG1_02_31_27]|nr:MAG: LPS biosynthesis protein WbpP [Candidatus Pacearchaeota archaeon CG1_02_31_27]PIN92524.1 MAG: LPS biosynthesis protein WbpP [Candidatus Pacearchaeota archaeon CG10_big_fil_rev_8_21_14_0_10_31_59]PIZ80386.1 MAG: LPS biosynthesis protein WbpP [Candidatus Pacearchaeota archaeon CG_4_10_14_0_2_um_filter_31_10]